MMLSMHGVRNGSGQIGSKIVGYLGWIGVNLDQGLKWDELAGVIEDAYLTVAPQKLREYAVTRPGYPIR